MKLSLLWVAAMALTQSTVVLVFSAEVLEIKLSLLLKAPYTGFKPNYITQQLTLIHVIQTDIH